MTADDAPAVDMNTQVIEDFRANGGAVDTQRAGSSPASPLKRPGFMHWLRV